MSFLVKKCTYIGPMLNYRIRLGQLQKTLQLMGNSDQVNKMTDIFWQFLRFKHTCIVLQYQHMVIGIHIIFSLENY